MAMTPLETKCVATIVCLGTNGWPACTLTNCMTECLNMAGGSGVVAKCVNDILAAASCQ